MTCFKSANSWREWDVTPQIPKVQQTVSSDGAPPNPSSSQGHITSSDKHSIICFFVFPGSFHIRICLVFVVVSCAFHHRRQEIWEDKPVCIWHRRMVTLAKSSGFVTPQWRAITGKYRCLWDGGLVQVLLDNKAQPNVQEDCCRKKTEKVLVPGISGAGGY